LRFNDPPVAVWLDRTYVRHARLRDRDMPEDASISSADVSRRSAVLLVAAAAGLMLAGTIALWAHYGTAVFFETIRNGLVACFG